MASKRGKTAATDELDELFEGIGDETTNAPKKTTGKHKSGKASKAAEPEKDILAELENELGESAPSRPHTPRIKEIAAAKGSPARRTPPLEAPRKSVESSKSASDEKKSLEEKTHPAASLTTATSAPYAATVAAGGEVPAGGWWGGFLSTASAAMKQAEAAVKEIQQNEEAKKWAEQVKGNVSALKGYGDELRHRALPTFTNILHTIAPPISSHERLLIHITHDMVGYPSLDPLVHGVFSRVMAQVEGGDLLVIQRGHENIVKSASSEKNFLGGHSAAGWRDGPWWRAVDSPRDLGAVPGLHEGTKLCRSSAEAYSAEYYAANGGVEEARQRAIEPVSESNPVRRSDLFLAVQAISVPAKSGSSLDVLFAGSAADAKKKESEEDGGDANEPEETICFAVYVLDPVHDIIYYTVSQEMPAKWIRWMDAPTPLTPATSSGGAGAGNDESAPVSFEDAGYYERVPEEIRDIVESGGVDPREWVAEWVEEALSLAVGVVAQRYVARRMGVGAGSIGRGKRREDAVLEDGGGEAARAGII